MILSIMSIFHYLVIKRKITSKKIYIGTINPFLDDFILNLQEHGHAQWSLSVSVFPEHVRVILLSEKEFSLYPDTLSGHGHAQGTRHGHGHDFVLVVFSGFEISSKYNWFFGFSKIMPFLGVKEYSINSHYF